MESYNNKQNLRELYTKLYNENIEQLEKLRKQGVESFKKILILIGVLLGLFVFSPILGIIGFFGLPVYFMISNRKEYKKKNIIDENGVIDRQKVENQFKEARSYIDIYKEKIVRPVLQCAISDCEYFPEEGMSELEYCRGEWEKFEKYNSGDKVVIKLDVDSNGLRPDLNISEVRTSYKKHNPSNNSYRNVQLFCGLAGYAKLPKDIGCFIRVIENNNSLVGNSNDRIRMDMSEFEKVFDVQTNDRVKAVQILTTDIMYELMELVNVCKVKFEFYIKNDTVYIRFHTGSMFAPSLVGNSIQYEVLEKYFDIVNAVKNITQHICNVIINTEL